LEVSLTETKIKATSTNYMEHSYREASSHLAGHEIHLRLQDSKFHNNVTLDPILSQLITITPYFVRSI